MHGLAGLLSSRLVEDQQARDLDAPGTKASKSSNSNSIDLHIAHRDKHLSKVLLPYCVYEATPDREIVHEHVSVKGLTLSNYALTALDMHIGNLSNKLQKIKEKLIKAIGSAADSKTTSLLRTRLAETCAELAEVLERGAAMHRESFRLRLKRFYENALVMQTRTSAVSKNQKKIDSATQKQLEKGMVTLMTLMSCYHAVC